MQDCRFNHYMNWVNKRGIEKCCEKNVSIRVNANTKMKNALRKIAVPKTNVKAVFAIN